MYGNLPIRAGTIASIINNSPNLIEPTIQWDFNNIVVFDFPPTDGNFNDRPRINIWKGTESDPSLNTNKYISGGFQFLSPAPTGKLVQLWGNRLTGITEFPQLSIDPNQVTGQRIIAGVDVFIPTFINVNSQTVFPPLNRWKVLSNPLVPGELQYQYQFVLGESYPKIRVDLDYNSNCKPVIFPTCGENQSIAFIGTNNFGCPIFTCVDNLIDNDSVIEKGDLYIQDNGWLEGGDLIQGRGGFGDWVFSSGLNSYRDISRSNQNGREIISSDSSFFFLGSSGVTQSAHTGVFMLSKTGVKPDTLLSGQSLSLDANFSWFGGGRSISFITGIDIKYQPKQAVIGAKSSIASISGIQPLYSISHNNANGDNIILTRSPTNISAGNNSVITSNGFNKAITYTVKNLGTGLLFEAKQYNTNNIIFSQLTTGLSFPGASRDFNVIKGLLFTATTPLNPQSSQWKNYGMYIDNISLLNNFNNSRFILVFKRDCNFINRTILYSLKNFNSLIVGDRLYQDYDLSLPADNGIYGEYIDIPPPGRQIRNITTENGFITRIGLCNDITIPESPTFITGNNITTSGFTLNWNNVITAASYSGNISTGISFNTNLYQFVTTSTGFNVTGLLAGKEYYAQVRSSNSIGDSYPSPTLNQITLSDYPGNLMVLNPTNNGFQISWLGSIGATGYGLDVSNSLNFSNYTAGYEDKLINGTVDNVQIASNNLVYYIRARSKNRAGNGPVSPTVSFRHNPIALLPPTNITVTNITANSFQISWGAVSNATSYRLDVSSTPFFTTRLPGYDDMVVSATSLSLTNLSGGSRYYFRVRSANNIEISENSEGFTVDTLFNQPSLIIISSTNNSIQIAYSISYNYLFSGLFIDVATNSEFTNFVPGYQNYSIQNISPVSTFLIENLNGGQTYYIRMRIQSSAGFSNYSETVIGITVPSVPNQPTATNVTTTSFTANWAAVTGATSYRLDVATNSTFTTFVTGYQDKTVSGTSDSVTGLINNTTYYVRVRAVNASGISSNSFVLTQIININTPPTPSRPTVTNVTATSFTANWLAVTGATSYRLDVATDSTFTNFLTQYNNTIVYSTNLSVTGLTAGTNYWIRVRSENGSATSSSSSSLNQITAPLPPQNFSTSNITATSFFISWAPVNTATSYFLDVSANSLFAGLFVPGYESRAINNNIENVTGLTEGVIYYVRVRAVNEGGASVYSLTFTQSTSVDLPNIPDAPIISDITSNSFKVSWNTISNATNYRLDVSTDFTFNTNFVTGYNSKIVNINNDLVTGLNSGVTYYVRVRAQNTGGISASSVTSSQITIPSAPNLPTVTNITANSFTANWAAITGAVSYRIDVATDPGFTNYVLSYQDKTASLIETITGLSGETTYYVRVRAINNSGSSSNSPTLTVITLIGLPIPPSLITISNANATGVTLSWNSVGSNVTYRLDISTSNTFNSFITGYNNKTVNTTSEIVTGLINCVIYYMRVRSVNSVGTSVSSSIYSFYTLPAAPNQPVVQGGGPTATSFRINWNSLGSCATSYRLDVATDSGFTNYVTGYQNRIVLINDETVTGLSGSTTYFFRVRAINNSGTGPNSSTGNVTTLVQPVPNDNILFNTSSFVGVVPEPYLTALNAAVARWSTYIKFNPTIATSIKSNVNQNWNGIQINSYNTINDSQSYIAACGVQQYFDIETSTPSVQFNTYSFNLFVNLYYASTLSANDWANVMTHELGHALGIGIYWNSQFQTQGAIPPSNFFLSSIAYPHAGAAYNSILGSNRPKIALETEGGGGTASAHWENSYRSSSAAGSEGFNYPGLQNELMVGFYSPSTTFVISNLSIRTLVDFGYRERNPGANEGNPTLVNF